MECLSCQKFIDVTEIRANAFGFELEELLVKLECLDEDIRPSLSPFLDWPGFRHLDGLALRMGSVPKSINDRADVAGSVQ